MCLTLRFMQLAPKSQTQVTATAEMLDLLVLLDDLHRFGGDVGWGGRVGAL